MKTKETKARSKRTGARFYVRAFTAAVMSMILIITLFPAAAFARGIKTTKVYVGAEESISGVVTDPRSYLEYLLFNPAKPVHVRVAYASDSVSRPDLKLTFSKEEGRTYKSVYESGLTSGKSCFDTYLPAGTYRISLSSQGTAIGRYRFIFSSEYIKDSFSKSKTNAEDPANNAPQITLAQNVCGSFLVGETGTHYYRFHEIAACSVGFDFICEPSSYEAESLNQNEDALFYVCIYNAAGSILDTDSRFLTIGKESKNVNFRVEAPGDYLVCVRPIGKSMGTYSFIMNQFASIAVKEAGAHRVVGDEVALTDFGVDRYEYVTHMYWESSDPSVLKILNRNKYQAQNAGKAVLSGFGIVKGDTADRFIYTKKEIVVEFEDVRHVSSSRADAYYYDPVYWAVEEGITAGYRDQNGLYSTFGPQKECTRAQMITFLWRMAGCPEPFTKSTFTDVKESEYYYKAVCWAKEKGITGGYSDGGFHPQTVCTRGQAVTFLYRLAGAPEVTADSKSTFKDVDPKGGAYYTDAVIWATQNGITGGYSDKTFRPSGNCTRAQMVTFLYRYAN